MAITVYDHPLSPYAQKVKIALEEKGVKYEAPLPMAIGSGQTSGEFAAANPRGEVPALIDEGFAVFDSTVILAYIEDKWPEPPLLPDTPEERARVRMLEDVMDTHYEAITWGLGEVHAFGRATGARAEEIHARAGEQLGRWHAWLEVQLGTRPWFNGPAFGHGDLAVAPFVNGASRSGFAPEGALGEWRERVNARESVARADRAAAEIMDASSGANLDAVRQLLEQGLFKREYRDHRLEWMVKVGGLDIVAEGLERDNIRFTDEFAS